jgi:hypothetical protein
VPGHVFGCVDEPAEDHRVVSLEQQLRDHLGQQRELGIGLAFQGGGAARETLQPPAVHGIALLHVAVPARGGIRGLAGFLIGQVKHGGAAQPVSLGHVLRVEIRCPGMQGRGGRPR